MKYNLYEGTDSELPKVCIYKLVRIRICGLKLWTEERKVNYDAEIYAGIKPCMIPLRGRNLILYSDESILWKLHVLLRACGYRH